MERVESVRWWGATPGTTVTEHPLVFALAATGVWGIPPDKQLSRSESIKIINAVGKQGTGEEQTLSTCSGSRRTHTGTRRRASVAALNIKNLTLEDGAFDIHFVYVFKKLKLQLSII